MQLGPCLLHRLTSLCMSLFNHLWVVYLGVLYRAFADASHVLCTAERVQEAKKSGWEMKQLL